MPTYMLGIYRLLFLFLSVFVCKILKKISPPRVDAGQLNLAEWKTWAGSRSSPILVNFDPGVSHQGQKWKMLVTHWTVESQLWHTGRWRRCIWSAPLASRHVGIYAGQDNWRTCFSLLYRYVNFVAQLPQCCAMLPQTWIQAVMNENCCFCNSWASCFHGDCCSCNCFVQGWKEKIWCWKFWRPNVWRSQEAQ